MSVAQPSRRVRILSVDDDELYQRLLRHTLSEDPHVEIVGQAHDAAEAIRLAEELRPDVVLMDVRMPGVGGIEATRRVKRAAPDTEVIALSGFGDDEVLRAIVEAGAIGYVIKEEGPDSILRAVRAAWAGESPLSPRVARTVLQDLVDLYRRERARTRMLESTMRASANALAAAIEARDGSTGVHSSSVPSLALDVLRRLNGTTADDPLVEFGFLLHDVGKIAVPDAILQKPGPLEEDEWAQMRQHPVWGVQVLQRIPGLANTVAERIVRHHHERWDGNGYPDRLRGNEIPLPCRAFGVIDAFDAMTRDRPYRKAMGSDRALEELKGGRGTQFDPDAVDAFFEVIREAS